MAVPNVLQNSELADAVALNANFTYLDNRITSTAASIYTNNASFESQLFSLNSSVQSALNSTDSTSRPIGQPIPRLDDTKFDDEVRLEGAEVSRTDYAGLFAIYGIDYGEGNGVTTFNLPDFRDRTLWGSSTAGGYVDGELPNITGWWLVNGTDGYSDGGGAFAQQESYKGPGKGHNSGQASGTRGFSFDASLMRYGENSDIQIYKDNTYLVRPTSIKVRWVTRFE